MDRQGTLGSGLGFLLSLPLVHTVPALKLAVHQTKTDFANMEITHSSAMASNER